MWASAEIKEGTLPVEADGLIGGQGFDQLDFERFIFGAVMRDRLIAAPNLPGDRFIAVNNFMHAGFDRREVFGRERCCTMKIIIKAVVDCRPDGYLRVGVKLPYRFSHYMGGIVANDFQRIVIPLGDDRKLNVAGDFTV